MITVDGWSLTIEGVVEVARAHAEVALSPDAARRMDRSHHVLLELIARGQPIYGVTTALADRKGVPIAPEEMEAFQRRIVLSHVVGAGPALPADVVRAIMVARANMLAAGGSGARPTVAERLIVMLNHRIHPRVPAAGSLGVTDLTHLAHIAQAVLGEGTVDVAGRSTPAAEALAAAGLSGFHPGPKEGLALISANAGSVGRGALVLFDLERLAGTLDVAAALSVEAFRANANAFTPDVEQAHPELGQAAAAAHLRRLLAGGDLADPGAARSLQDPYSFRCVPQMHGVLRGGAVAARDVIELELNAAADTPLITVEPGGAVSTGNFLALGLALAFEQLALALAHATAFSVARLRALTSGRLTGLPGTLIDAAAPQTGLSILQELATNVQTAMRGRANPSSLDFQPIADGVEDHATNAMDAVAKVEAGVADAAVIVAAELLAAAQAVDLRGLLRLGAGTRRAHDTIRRDVPFLREDAPLAPFVEILAARVRSGEFLAAVEGSGLP
ncbi:MAG TPA: aromatic amino acid lyase [bacterium]|nr:aromatic amino acid lyase [bacterium]